ncbi:MAG: 3-deoxy-manno-octulosonate cytidylyltransferase [Panacagrimonas sp.]
MKFKVVIPARLASTRLPQKVLRQIAGKPLIQYVWQAAKGAGADQVVVACDDERVLSVVNGFGAQAMMTDPAHQSGTDRVNEVARKAAWGDDSIVVNLQGDEPLMPAALVQQAASLLAQDPRADLATLGHQIESARQWLDPNVVKLVMDAEQFALYFSRAPIPWQRDARGDSDADHFPAGLAYRHIGLYAYRVGSLRRFSGLPAASVEQCEALEQLRALSNGFRIKVGITGQAPPPGVDTEADLLAVADVLRARTP